MNLPAYVITLFVIISSCTSATSTTTENNSNMVQETSFLDTKADDPEPPQRATFNMLATIRPDNSAKEGFKVTGTTRGFYLVSIESNTISIEMSSSGIGNRNFLIRNYTKQKKAYTGGTVQFALLYIGKDVFNNDLVEVEYMFGAANDLQMIVIRSGGIVAALQNIPHTNKESSKNTQLIGCWFMPHNGSEAIRFFSDQTFQYSTYISNENDFTGKEVLIKGTYKFDGKNIILLHNNGKKETCQFYVEKMDGLGRIKRQSQDEYYLYLKTECD